MLNVDISNIWCSVSLPALLEREPEIARAHAALMDGEQADFLSWLDAAPDLARLLEAAARIRETSQALVVVGDGDAVLGAEALWALLGNPGGLEVLFTGGSFSTHAWQRLSERLEGRDFSVQVVGRRGLSMSAAVTLRSLRWLLERRYGTEKARERLLVATDPERGVLRQLSVAEGYTAFNLPGTLAGDASVLTPAALLGPAAAGVDVAAVLAGASVARRAMEVRAFENPAWLYATARHILAARGKQAEYLVTAEPDARALCRWWQRLFGGRTGGAPFPATAELPADFERLGETLCGGAPVLETVLRFAPPAQQTPVEMDWKNIDGLNYLEGYTLDGLQEQAVAAVLQAGSDGGVPVITVECGPLGAETAGELLYFFELAGCLSAGLLGRDVYRAAPPPAWQRNLEQLLNRLESPIPENPGQF